MSNFAAPHLAADEFSGDEPINGSSVYVSLGLCQLNQWAMDFDGNCSRIMESIRQVKALGGHYRLGPELEVSGYSCDDHFVESDTTSHSWQTIVKLLKTNLTHNCLVDVGMAVEHKSVRYNCRVFMLNGKIILIRPKLFLANGGAYREIRWFGPWKQSAGIEEFVLPKSVQRVHKQVSCPFGFAGIQCNDCILASETCEELFVPQSPHLTMCLGGVDIFTNGSASYYQIGKLKTRFELIMAPMAKMGGVYMYANLKGNDGGKLGFDGSSFIACNGELVNIIKPYQVDDVEVMVEQINVSRVRSYRASDPSYAYQASGRPMPTIQANIWLSGTSNSSIRVLKLRREDMAKPLILPDIPEELMSGSALWMWDFLRRSGAQGIFIATSGGTDSSCVIAIARLMCNKIMESINNKIAGVAEDVSRVLRIPLSAPEFPKTADELCFQLVHTMFISMRASTEADKERARAISKYLHTYHLESSVDEAVDAFVNSASGLLGFVPRTNSKPGATKQENTALRNVHARCRMVASYLVAGLLPCVRARDRMAPPPTKLDVKSQEFSPRIEDQERFGTLLCVATNNADEAVRGYFTKFDTSAGDLAPIGSISRVNIHRMLVWAAENLSCPIFIDILNSPPMADIGPDEREGYKRLDEFEMGLTYDELYMFTALFKSERCGAVEMFERLGRLWRTCGNPTAHVVMAGHDPHASPEEVEARLIAKWLTQEDMDLRRIAEKVKHFFRSFAWARHKSNCLPPSYHAEPHDVDASRYDWRPFLYPEFDRSFRQIDQLVATADATAAESTGTESHMPVYLRLGLGSYK